MKVLLLASYCRASGCSDDLPCEDCLKRCNIIEIKDNTEILGNDGGWDHQRHVADIKIPSFLP